MEEQQQQPSNGNGPLTTTSTAAAPPNDNRPGSAFGGSITSVRFNLHFFLLEKKSENCNFTRFFFWNRIFQDSPSTKDILDVKLEILLRQWAKSVDILFTIHPVDGSLVTWFENIFLNLTQMKHFQDSGMAGWHASATNDFIHQQISWYRFHFRLFCKYLKINIINFVGNKIRILFSSLKIFHFQNCKNSILISSFLIFKFY